jgi:hypothetical protein
MGSGTFRNPFFTKEPVMTQIDKLLYTGRTHTSSGGRDGGRRHQSGAVVRRVVINLV